MEKNNDNIERVIGNTVRIKHLTIEDAVVQDAKQFGVHISIDLKNEETFLTYGHWYKEDNTNVLTKRKVARRFVKAWNPLQEMGLIINPRKMCLSKIWKLQKFHQKRQIQTRFDFKEKGRYKPLSNTLILGH